MFTKAEIATLRFVANFFDKLEQDRKWRQAESGAMQAQLRSIATKLETMGSLATREILTLEYFNYDTNQFELVSVYQDREEAITGAYKFAETKHEWYAAALGPAEFVWDDLEESERLNNEEQFSVQILGTCLTQD
jgi:hypothetical protein